MNEGLNGIYKMSFPKFRLEAKVLRRLIIGPGPCNFKILLYRLFLESVHVGKQELGLILDPSFKGHEIPPYPPYIQPLGRHLDFVFCLD